MTSEERKCAARISYVILDSFPKMLQELSLKGMKPHRLHQQYINNPRDLVKKLRLTDEEKDMISKLSTEQTFQTCDLSLLYKVIRNFNLVPVPANGWGKKVFGLRSTGDAVEGLRRIRNNLMHRPNAKYDKRKELRVFNESLDIARFIDGYLKKTTDTFEDEILSHQSWDPEKEIREKYICALEKLLELEDLGVETVNGWEIAMFIAKDLHWDQRSSETTEENIPLTVYVRAKCLNKDAVIQKLNEMKDIINKGQYKIIFKYAENGSVILHVAAVALQMNTKDSLVSEMKEFVRRVFSILNTTCMTRPYEQHDLALWSFTRKRNTQVECVFATSDIIEEEEMVYDEYDDSWLKMKVTVDSSMLKTPESLKDNINGFIGNIMQATGYLHSPNKKVKVHIHPDKLNIETENRKRQRQRDEELNEDVKCWKKIRHETLPRLNDLKQELYRANDKIKAVRTARNITTGTSLIVGALLAPFTGGASLVGAAAMTTGAAGITLVLETIIEKNVIKTTQDGVNRDKTETVRLRHRVTAFQGTDSSPYAEELFTLNLDTIIKLSEKSLWSFLQSWAGTESTSLSNAITTLDTYINNLEMELNTVEEVQGKYAMP